MSEHEDTGVDRFTWPASDNAKVTRLLEEILELRAVDFLLVVSFLRHAHDTGGWRWTDDFRVVDPTMIGETDTP